MKHARKALLGAALCLLIAATPGEASQFGYADPIGDAAGGKSGLDIVSVSYATTGRTERGRYVATSLVVTVKAADDIVQAPGATYSVDADIVGCGWMTFTYSAQTEASGRLYTTCAPNLAPGYSRVYEIDAEVQGDTLTLIARLSQLESIGVGQVLRGFETYTTAEDPVFAVYGSRALRDGANVDAAADAAFSDGRWVIR